jgi:molybdopterin-guanine dinucleotide biosynthesis protein A
MGRDKATLRVQGRELAEISEAALTPHCDAVHRLGPSGIPDDSSAAGPLAGIIAALAHTPEAWWVIVACDMPLLRPDAIAWLLSARAPGVVAVLPRTPDGRVQPTCALYGPGAEPLLRKVTAPIQLNGQPEIFTPDVPPHLAHQWTNVNDPEALRALSLSW